MATLETDTNTGKWKITGLYTKKEENPDGIPIRVNITYNNDTGNSVNVTITNKSTTAATNWTTEVIDTEEKWDAFKQKISVTTPNPVIRNGKKYVINKIEWTMKGKDW